MTILIKPAVICTLLCPSANGAMLSGCGGQGRSG